MSTDTPLVELTHLKVSTDSSDRLQTCWKCRGEGSKLMKKRADDSGRKRLILVECRTCDGKGSPQIKKSKTSKSSLRFFKLNTDWKPWGPKDGGIPFSNGDWNAAALNPSMLPKENEMLCSLSGYWGIYQFVDGHKFTTDDVCTAGFTIQTVLEESLPVRRYIDLGTGLGSVLMMVTWKFFGQLEHICAIEAQSKHIHLAKKSFKLNNIEGLIELYHGDLRFLDNIHQLQDHLNTFDLITGTPPYFIPSVGVFSNISGRSMCSFELRGGVEVYFEAAVKLLSDSVNARFIVCQTSLEILRTEIAAKKNGLHVIKRYDVFGKRGKIGPLFSIFVCGWSSYFNCDCIVQNFFVREEDRGYSIEMKAMTELLGKPVPIDP